MKKLFSLAAALLAVCAVSAQNELITKYNDGLTALQNKDYVKAAALFEEVVDAGVDSEDTTVLNCVATAKKYIPVVYLNMGGAAAQRKNYDDAIEKFTIAAEKGELYGELQTAGKAKQRLATVYQLQGGEPFNNQDWAAAAAIFEKGYAANPRNTKMANWLGTCYCEMGEFEKGMDVLGNVAANTSPRAAEDAAEAKRLMTLYTNNRVASLQAANDYDGIIAMSEQMIAANPADALAYKVRIQAYNGMKAYDKVIELGEETANAQFEAADRSDVYFLVGAAYNAKYNAGGNKDAALKDNAIEALKKVTDGSNVEAAQKSIADLTVSK